MKCYISSLLSLLVLLVSVMAFSLVAYADDLESVEVSESTSNVQDEQTDVAPWEPIAPETTDEDIQDAQSEGAASETDAGTNDGQQGTRTTSSIEYIANSEYEYETLVTLKSIEYQLKIIAGAVVIGVIGFYVWFTIYLPIKKFMYV